ncbi:protein-L-isoaspartate(D-aspartate) O-methyltransferase [candidate division WOR-3 bacterium]|nr:protein-L-isoaspartate(D-aspartate) O-methyltransferase [candidate division WOR-3 bacterium]
MKLLRHSNRGNFELLRRQMVEEQVKSRGICDENVIQAMLKVERHLFVPKRLQDEAYEDYPLQIGESQTISQPYMVAAMTAELELSPEDKVLEIGTGSGYQSAILAEIVSEVFTIEWIDMLAKRAKLLLEELDYKNIFVEIGDGSLGWQGNAPYDGILVTSGAPEMPELLFEQLRENGRLVIPIGGRIVQTLTKITKIKGKSHKKQLFDCMFVPLLGVYGWKN